MSYNFPMNRVFYYRGLWVSVNKIDGQYQINVFAANPSEQKGLPALASLVSPIVGHHVTFYFPEITTDRLAQIHLYQRAVDVAMELWGSFDLLTTTNHLPKGALIQPTLAA